MQSGVFRVSALACALALCACASAPPASTVADYTERVVTRENAKHALAHGWPGGTFVAWLADSMATPTVGLIAGVLPQLFPTGRTLGPRWLTLCARKGGT